MVASKHTQWLTAKTMFTFSLNNSSWCLKTIFWITHHSFCISMCTSMRKRKRARITVMSEVNVKCRKYTMVMYTTLKQNRNKSLTQDVSFIDDLWLDDLFNDIFQGDNTDILIVWIMVTLVLQTLNYCHVGIAWSKFEERKQEQLTLLNISLMKRISNGILYIYAKFKVAGSQTSTSSFRF